MNEIDVGKLNRIYAKSSASMDEVPDESIHLMVTSPPYNVGIEYAEHDDALSMDDYQALLRAVFSETYRVLVPGGRACINIAGTARQPYKPLARYVCEIMDDLGFLMRGEIIWDKGAAGLSTAWGSWMMASNPVLRDQHEYILAFSKGTFARENLNSRENTISKDEFVEFTRSIWRIQPEAANRIDHPAPFPVELPYRCIQLYTFAGEVVIDPFAGSGSSCIAALQTGRGYVGYDISAEYCRLAEQRIALWKKLNSQLSLLPPG